MKSLDRVTCYGTWLQLTILGEIMKKFPDGIISDRDGLSQPHLGVKFLDKDTVGICPLGEETLMVLSPCNSAVEDSYEQFRADYGYGGHDFRIFFRRREEIPTG